MKIQILIISLIANFGLAADTNMNWVNQKIEEIKPERNGLNISTLKRLKSPFIVLKSENSSTSTKSTKKNAVSLSKNSPTKRDMSKEPLTLQMVLNSSALINGNWLKENDKTRGYKLTQIQSGYVVLERKNKKIKLFIAQKSKNLNISTK